MFNQVMNAVVVKLVIPAFVGVRLVSSVIDELLRKGIQTLSLPTITFLPAATRTCIIVWRNSPLAYEAKTSPGVILRAGKLQAGVRGIANHKL